VNEENKSILIVCTTIVLIGFFCTKGCEFENSRAAMVEKAYIEVGYVRCVDSHGNYTFLPKDLCIK